MARPKLDISNKERALLLYNLKQAARSFKGGDAVSEFIDRTLTEGEKLEIARRITIARHILKGHTYMEIYEHLRISPNTYSKINKWLKEQLPGYSDVLEQARTKEKDKAKRTRERYDKFSSTALQRKYPMHFLLFSAAEALTDKLSKRK